MSKAKNPLNPEDKVTPGSEVCKKCLSKDVGRIPRGWIVKKFLPFLNLKHYQCYNCLYKFYRR